MHNILRAMLVTALLAASTLAHATVYKSTDSNLYPMEIGPDTFKNRVRYWAILPDGSASVYEVAEKIRPGTYQQVTVNNEGGATRLIFKDKTLTIQHRYVGKVVNSDVYEK